MTGQSLEKGLRSMQRVLLGDIFLKELKRYLQNFCNKTNFKKAKKYLQKFAEGLKTCI